MTATIKICLFPSKEQELKFRQFAGAARFTYNWALATRQKYYEEYDVTLKVQELIELLRDYRAVSENSWICDIPEAVTKQSIKDMDTAYKQFFKRGRIGFPRFKRKSRVTPSFYQRTDRVRLVTATRVVITGVGYVKIRPLDWFPPKPQNCRVKYDGKHWYLTVSYEIESQNRVDLQGVMAIDLGVRNLATCSKGLVFNNINKTSRVLKLRKRLKRLQRQVCRKYELNKQGNKFVKTQNIIKLERKIRLLHRRLRNINDHHLHLATKRIMDTKPAIVVLEDLNVSGMLKNRHLAKAIQRQCFHRFRQYLSYKAEYIGTKVVLIPRFYPSSKLCSSCGCHHSGLKQSDYTFSCPSCSYTVDRDINAVRNMELYVA